MRKAIVTIGNDRELTFNAYLSEFTWNNFEVPYLREEDVLKCINYIDEFDVHVCIEDYQLIMYVGDSRNIISESITIDGETHYLFDLGWTFEIGSEPMPSFVTWSLDDLVAYCKSGDNSNGDWEDVRESERDYLLETATKMWIENKY